MQHIFETAVCPQLIQSNPTFRPLEPIFTKDTHGKPNEQLFPKQVVIQLP